MKRKDVLLAVAMASTLSFGAAWAKSAPQYPSVPGELIVKVKNQKSALQSLKSVVGVEVVRQLRSNDGKVWLVKGESKSLESLKQSLEAQPNVEYAEPNYIYTTNLYSTHEAPNDPRFGELWGLKNTGANEPGGSRGTTGADVDAMRAWDLTSGSKQVKVAVIDTGIDYNHPDLAANMWLNEAEANGQAGVDDDNNGYVDDVRGYDFANNDGDPMDGHSHGTHCAGTIGAVHNNGVGVAGVMNDVTFVAVKFLSDSGSGTTAAAIEAIDYATAVNVDIMSNSWGGGGFSQALKESIERAREAGILFVAAAGNSTSNNDATPHYPSNYEVSNVIAVAAHTAQDTLASFSSYGRRTVHVAAPGHKILSTVKSGGYAVYSGTSMATPHVAGALGLLLAQEGRMDVTEVRERLMATSNPIATYRRKTVSGGRLNAYNLLTNTRPTRSGPSDDAWETVTLTESFESAHPYIHNANVSREIKVEGAKYIRVKVERLDLEQGYDFLKVSNGARAEIESLSGTMTAYDTDYVEGDTLVLSFVSDGSVNKWGYLVRQIEVIR
jgi:thermitase